MTSTPRQAPHTTTPHTTTPQHTALPGPAGGPRNLDLRYADRPVDSEHPHYFPFVVDHAEPWLRDHPDGPVCEVGCAAGAFAHYLLGRHPGTDLTCVDLQPTLIEQARLRVPGARFLTGDVLRPDTLPAGPFTTVFMVALHSHFDDPQRWIDALLRLTAPGGRAYVFGLFNPEPVDVVIRLRHSDSDPEWLPGWNQFSVQTVGRLLDAAGLGHAFHRYLPTAPRARQSQDPLRSHTVPDPDAHPEAGADPALVYLNGSQMLHRFALLEIHRPEAEAAAAGDRS
ncbi:class I SAM-dependent methyltransferase (plasmid) [Streptomyces goshikiensis]|uniref:class I SAM-dependent methyltransferase n=1 Tax=Streptomyces goshikiensis TaxID=1942 RepID=UPI002F9188E9|nr:class I SAM-dependent methyltransferase [Streptomyces goshikiensis]